MLLPARTAGAAPRPPPPAPSTTTKRRLRLAGLSLALLFSLEQLRPPERQVSARVLLAGIHAYQHHLSSKVAALGTRCRFTPTCSHYGEGAIRRDGALIGSLRAAWRILRCGPWTPAGTHDPP